MRRLTGLSQSSLYYLLLFHAYWVLHVALVLAVLQEQLCGANQFACESCKAMCDADRGIVLCEPPKVQHATYNIQHATCNAVLCEPALGPTAAVLIAALPLAGLTYSRLCGWAVAALFRSDSTHCVALQKIGRVCFCWLWALQVLSLQLLRFVYDASSGCKKKMNNTIKYNLARRERLGAPRLGSARRGAGWQCGTGRISLLSEVAVDWLSAVGGWAIMLSSAQRRILSDC